MLRLAELRGDALDAAPALLRGTKDPSPKVRAKAAIALVRQVRNVTHAATNKLLK